MTIQQAPKRSYAASSESSPTPSPEASRTDESAPATDLDARNQDIDGTHAAGGSPKKRWVRMATGIDPSSSRADGPTDPTQFTAGPTTRQTTGARQPVTTAPLPGAAPVVVTPEDAMDAFGFIPRDYTPDLPSPGSVFFNLAHRLERVLDGAGESLDAVRQTDVASVLLAAEMYADDLGQPGMKKCLETASWTDRDQLRTLARHMAVLGSHLLFPSGEAAQAARTPNVSVLLKSHYDAILRTRTEAQLQRHCRALTGLLQSAAPGEHVPLNRACVDYLKGGGALQGVIDALVDALKNSPLPTPLLPPFDAARALIGRMDVRRGLRAADEMQQQFTAKEQWVQQSGELENWLRSMDRAESPLGAELLALVDACISCRTSDGSAQAIDTLRDALSHCMDTASAAALDLQVGRHVATIRASTSQWGSHYSLERITAVVDHYLKHPAATTVQVVQALGVPYESVDRVRGELRKYVASSVPDDRLASVLTSAINGASQRDYARRVSHLVQDRLINPQALPLWNKMVGDYGKEFPQSPLDIFDLVKRRDASLIRRIPDVRPIAGAMYTNLFATDDSCCVPMEEAYDMFKVALAAAMEAEAGAVEAAAEPTSRSSPIPSQSAQPKNQ